MENISKLAVILLAVSFAGAAHADPVSLLASVFVTALGEGAAVLLAQQVLSAAVVVTLGAYTTASAKRKAKAAAAKARTEYNSGLSDRMTTVLSAEAPQKTVYGTSYVGGTVVAMFTTDRPEPVGVGSLGAPFSGVPTNSLKLEGKSKDALRHLVVVLTAHEVVSIGDIKIDGISVGALDAQGYPVSGDYHSETRGYRSFSYVVPASGVIPLPEVPAEVVSVTTMVERSSGHGADRVVEARIGYTLSGSNITVSTSYAGSTVKVAYGVTIQTSPIRIRKHLGEPGQAADSYLMSVAPGKWTADHRLEGYSYLVITLDLNDRRFQSGLVGVQVQVQGKKVYDPRTGLTAYSENVALCLADFLQSPMWAGSSSISVVQEDLIASANVCDEQIPDLNGTSTMPRYTCNGAFSTDDDPQSIMDDLQAAMAGDAFVAGGWRILAGTWTTPVAHLDVAQADGQVEVVQVGASWSDVVNSVRGNYIPLGDTASKDFPPYTNAAMLSADGQRLWDDVSFPFTNSAQRCTNLCRIRVERSRNGFVLRWPASVEHWGLQPGDRVWVTYPALGIYQKTFRVTEWSFSLQSPVMLTLEEDSSEVYDLHDQAVPDQTQNTDLPSPTYTAPVEGLQATSGTGTLVRLTDGTIVPSVRVSWTYDAGLIPGTEIEVQYTDVLLSDTSTVKIVKGPADIGQVSFSGVSEGQGVLIQARYVSRYVVGPWRAVFHEVVGKSEPPSDVSSVSISGNVVSFTPVSDIDVVGYLIRVNPGDDRWWDYARPLHEGLVTESPYSLQRTPVGLSTVMVKAVDSSGNVSANPAFSVYSFPEPEVDNVLVSYPQHPTFGGVITNGSVVSGELLADALDRMFEPDDGPLYLPSDDPMYPASQYAAMSYEFSVIPAQVGSLLVLVEAASTYTVYYRVGGAEPMYDPSADPMYLPSDEPTFGIPSEWQPWPGSLSIDGTVQVSFRVSTPAGDVQGVVSGITVVLDVPDIEERLSAVSISSSGTRLPISSSYHSIVGVHLTTHSGGAGVSSIIVDKDPVLGPLVRVVNSSGTAVAGVVDALVQGY